MNALPDKLSALVRVALADLSLCESDPAYKIYMSDWHAPYHNEPCEVCLAGAVIAKTLEAPIGNYSAPSNFPNDDTRTKLYALNDLRCGQVTAALRNMDREDNKDDMVLAASLNRDVVEYGHGRERFFEEMNVLADDLEKVGL